MNISTVSIIYNEEELLGGMIDSVSSIASEIIIVDGGSQDKSVNIAESMGARVFVKQQPADMSNFSFGEQWSYAMDQATGDWIFLIAADVRLCSALKSDIKDLLSGMNASIDAIETLRLNYINGMPAKMSPREYHIRIVRNLPYLRFSKNQTVHEHLNPFAKGVLRLDDKYHVVHDKTQERMDRQSKFYSDTFYRK